MKYLVFDIPGWTNRQYLALPSGERADAKSVMGYQLFEQMVFVEELDYIPDGVSRFA